MDERLTVEPQEMPQYALKNVQQKLSTELTKLNRVPNDCFNSNISIFISF